MTEMILVWSMPYVQDRSLDLFTSSPARYLCTTDPLPQPPPHPTAPSLGHQQNAIPNLKSRTIYSQMKDVCNYLHYIILDSVIIGSSSYYTDKCNLSHEITEKYKETLKLEKRSLSISLPTERAKIKRKYLYITVTFYQHFETHI